ncbi:MAG: hypothetical protein K2P81_01475 [Bacteriovoracaceae bacterium]|nr:hypothetical protein [Bacteriovoracaceae bacterium]
MKKTLSSILLLTLIVCVIYSKSTIMNFVDPDALIFVFGIPLLITIAKYSLLDIKSLTDEVCETLSVGGFLGAAISTIFSFVSTLQAVSDSTQLGPILATSSLSLFYALILTSITASISSKKLNPVILTPTICILIVVGLTALTHQITR